MSPISLATTFVFWISDWLFDGFLWPEFGVDFRQDIFWMMAMQIKSHIYGLILAHLSDIAPHTELHLC